MDNLTQEEHEELVNVISEFFYQAEKARLIITCAVILIIFVALLVWML